MTDHLDAFVNYSKNMIHPLSFLRKLPSGLHLQIFDGIIIHYSTAIGYLRDHYIDPETREKIRDFKGLKIVFIQDEYRSVNTVIHSLRHMKIHVLFTCVPKNQIEKVYPKNRLPGVTKINNLTGYVPEKLIQLRPLKVHSRPIDVGYRSRKPPFWLGQLGFEKHEIAASFKQRCKGSGLRIDVSCHETDRIYGKAWIRFVSSCKAMLGVESGSSVFDFEGKIQNKVDNHVAQNPGADFRSVQRKFLMPYENKIRLNQISPRCFEAAALGTAMILYEGKYSGILKPGRHFIPLKKDFSNFPKVLKKIKQSHYLQKIADRAFTEIACNPSYSYRNFIRKFDSTVKKEFRKRRLKRSSNPCTKKEFYAALIKSPGYCFHQVVSRSMQKIFLGTFFRKALFKIWGQIPIQRKTILRPFLKSIGR